MKYYTIVLNQDIFAKYIEKSSDKIALISFCENDFEEIYQCFKQSCQGMNDFDDGMLNVVFFEFIGEDNYSYKMNYSNGEIKKGFKWPLKKLINQYKSSEKIIVEEEKIKNQIAQNYNENKIIKHKSLIPNYGKYNFIDRDSLESIAFRFKKSSKKEKMPLVIYFHGAGALGNDNVKQFLEYMGMGMGVSKRKCNVLVPQCKNGVGENIALIRKYCNSIKKLIEKLTDIAEIDFDRIYIVGASYGGACVWYSMYECPGFYTAAIALMGYFPTYNAHDFDVKKFEKENIWIGHAINDKAVSIKDDETMYHLLKNEGYNVKMSTYKRYGHKMSGIFLRKEKWKKWLFEQKKQS